MEKTGINFRKSTYSGNGGGNCVEVGGNAQDVLVRDTKRGEDSPVLQFSPEQWRRFAASLKAGQ